MTKTRIKLGYCPTRRDIFDRQTAIDFGKRIKDRISKFDVDVVDLTGINEENLLFADADIEKVIDKFNIAKVDAVFFPHCNFGSENRVAQVARALGVPVLLWGPRDDKPDEKTGFRTRDTQCGLFATGKVLRRHNVPFTYITNTALESDYFEDRFEKFLSVASVVKAVRGLNILQISTRPEPFATVMCNEGELLERFDIHLYPITLNDVVLEMGRIKEECSAEFSETVRFIESINRGGSDEGVKNTAALKLAMRNMAEKYRCRAVAIQCWTSLQDMVNIMPCLANGLLSDEGIPVVCETDIHGAITAVMTQAATMNERPQFFADLTVRHYKEENVELLWHCGNFPYSLAKKDCDRHVCEHWLLKNGSFGTCMWELENGDITVLRFDGDHGEYSLFIGEAEAIDGPYTGGSYTWIKCDSWPEWEHKLVTGPYIHHVSGVYGSYADVFTEACKYLGIKPDPVKSAKEASEARWLGN